MQMNEFKSPWRIVEHCSDIMVLDVKRWVIDVDDTEDGSKLVNELKDTIAKCDSKVENPFDAIFPTRSGVHIITHPFNMHQFAESLLKKGIVETEKKAKEMIKKNHLTLLYENIKK
jgi:hypothetical protein